MSSIANTITLVAAMTLCGTSLAQQSVADRKAEMAAQVELLRLQEELNGALVRSAGNTLSSLPKIIAVMGMENRLVARLQSTNGIVNNYSEGQTIRPGMAVTSITPRQVTVTLGSGKRAKTVPLEFLAGAAVPPGFPGGPPLPVGSPIDPMLLPPPPQVRLPLPNPGATAWPPRGAASVTEPTGTSASK